MNEQTTIKNKSQKKLFLKIGFIFLLVILLMIPITWIQSMIYERQGLQHQVEQDIAYAWGRQQLISGPLLVIPYSITTKRQNGEMATAHHRLYLTPEEADINNITETNVRTKGIFNTIVFDNECDLNVSFDFMAYEQNPNYDYKLNESYILVGLSDASTIISGVEAKINNILKKSRPGVSGSAFTQRGFHTPIDLTSYDQKIEYSVSMNFRGTSQISFEPVAKTTTINLTSNWPSPSFTGKNLPQTREITDEGFTATWQASEYNRSFPDFWKDKEYTSIQGDNPGVKFIETANHYQKNIRSIKYGMLIIFLSFLMYFSTEIFLQVKVHPIQYALIGISLVLFYTLLLSLSEHIGFNKAYLISTSAVLTLVATYSYAILKKAKPTLVIGLLFLLIYGFIFILLQLEDYALLAGSVGIFVILGLMMFYSRKINWYQLSMESTA